jgi:hypothetical protein
MPPCKRSFRRAVSSVAVNRSFMAVLTSDLSSIGNLDPLDSLTATFVACNSRAATNLSLYVRPRSSCSSINRHKIRELRVQDFARASQEAAVDCLAGDTECRSGT